MPGSLQLGGRRLGEIGEPFGGRDTRTAFQPGREGLADHPGPESPGETVGGRQSVGPGRVSTDHDHRRFTGSQGGRYARDITGL